MNMNLPDTTTVTFERKRSLLNWDNPIFVQEDRVNWDNPIFAQEDPDLPDGISWSSYISVCDGDSGTPQMFYDYDAAIRKNEPKFVVAAIAQGQVGLFNIKDDREISPVPCGTRTLNKGKIHEAEENIIKSIGIGQRITHPEIHDWIKSFIVHKLS